MDSVVYIQHVEAFDYHFNGRLAIFQLTRSAVSPRFLPPFLSKANFWQQVAQVCYGPDAFPVIQPTVTKDWRHSKHWPQQGKITHWQRCWLSNIRTLRKDEVILPVWGQCLNRKGIWPAANLYRCCLSGLVEKEYKGGNWLPSCKLICAVGLWGEDRLFAANRSPTIVYYHCITNNIATHRGTERQWRWLHELR